MNRLANRMRKIARGEEGAVTVDWVILTGVLLVAGISAMRVIFDTGVDAVADGINQSLENATGTLEGLNPVNPGGGDGDGDG